MRVCFLLGAHFAKAMGGAEYQAKLLLEATARRSGCELFYLARKVPDSATEHGHKVICVANAKGFRRDGFFWDTFNLFNALKTIQPHVIYQRCLLAYTGIAVHYAKKRPCRMVFHVSSDNDLLPDRFKRSLRYYAKFIDKRIGEYGIHHADQIVVQSRNQQKLLADNFGRTPNAIIRNFHPYPEETIDKTGPVTIVWVANFKEIKQPEVFVRLARDLQTMEGVRFIMVGRTGNPGQYDRLIGEINVLNNLSHTGELPQYDVNRFLAKAHLLVNTSTAEGFSNTFIQAWMREVPVISLHVNPDGVFDDRSIGFCSGSYAQLRTDVQTLAGDGHLRAAMGESARCYAMANHSMANADALVDLLLQS